MITALAVACSLSSQGTLPHVEYDAAVRTEARARTAVAGEAGAAGADLSLVPSLALRSDWGALEGTLRYGVRLTERPLLRARPDLWHDVFAEGVYESRPSFAYRLTQQFSIGALDLTGVAAPQRPDAAPPRPGSAAGLALTGVSAVESETALSAGGRLDQRNELSVAGGYRISGGMGEEAQALLPLARGPFVRGTYRHQLTPLYTADAGAEVLHVDFSSGRAASIAQAAGGFGALLGKRTRGSARVGAAALRSAEVGERPAWAAGPVLAVDVAHWEPVQSERVEGLLALALVPAVDRFTGVVAERVEAALSVGAPLHPSLLLGVRADGAYTVTGPQAGDWLAQVEAAGGYIPARMMLLQFGARYGRQHYGAVPFAPANLWSVFVAFSMQRTGAL